jgi:hypothetical protein
VINFHDRGIYIQNTGHDCTINVTAGTIKTVGTFSIARENTIFAGGEVELYGTGLSAIMAGPGAESITSRSTNKLLPEPQKRSQSLEGIRFHHLMIVLSMHIWAQTWRFITP